MIHTHCLHVRTSEILPLHSDISSHIHILQEGYTALYLAAQEGHEDIVELLLGAKADPNLKMKVIIL